MTQSAQAKTASDRAGSDSDGRVDGETIRASAEQILDDIPFFGRMAGGDEARSRMLDVLAQVPLPDAVARQLALACDTRHEVYLHLVRTAITAVWLARTPALTRCDTAMAAAAGLLHDIGMLQVDAQILDPDHVLNREQRRQLVAHPLLSTAILERLAVYPAEVIRAVGEHHECLDGSGYPRNLAGDAISPLGKILALAQVVAAMFGPGRSSPEMRLSVLLRMTWHRYDNTMGMQVLSMLKPHLDVMSAEMHLLEDPIATLCEIDRLLRQWPLPLDGAGNPSAGRRAGMETLSANAAQIRRVLAGVGAVPSQLVLLEGHSKDNALQVELTLLTREACWQLGTLARQTHRRWHAQPDEDYPPAMQRWLTEVESVVASVSGTPAPEAGTQGDRGTQA